MGREEDRMYVTQPRQYSSPDSNASDLLPLSSIGAMGRWGEGLHDQEIHWCSKPLHGHHLYLTVSAAVTGLTGQSICSSICAEPTVLLV